ncbi:MAG: site-specific integrase [Rhabdochlamydiaceae bacterium]|nr:site-specific integrase [Rhabdochlamydiaceae bacterium]
MAYIEKRTHSSGKTSYRVRIRMRGAPSISESFPTRREAKEWASKMEADIRQGRYFGRSESKERTFADLVDRYMKQKDPKNPKSFEKCVVQLLWWKEHLKKYYLCHITPSTISELKELLLKEKTPRGTLRSQSTANRYLAALSSVFGMAVKEWNWLKENPVSKISRYKEGKPRDRFLTKEEIENLLNICKKSKSPHLYAVTLFAICSGARRGEILSLKWKDVDFDRQTATFRDTKNGETRTIPLGSSLLNCLLAERTKRVCISEYVFPSADGKRPGDIRGAWENAIKEAGLAICFHTLRHTAASHLTMGGASMIEVGAILGHKTLAMIKRYSHLSVTAAAKVLSRMNDEVLGISVNGA